MLTLHQQNTYKMDSRQKLTDFSSLSVINVVDKFVKAVDTMNETVMVPSRLLNVELPSKSDKIPILLQGNSDPYTFYTVLNTVKNNLVWGLSDESDDVDDKCIIPDSSAWLMSSVSSSTSTIAASNKVTSSDSNSKSSGLGSTKGHFRRISSVSSSSVASSISDPECERLSDAGDSGVDSEEILEPVTTVTSTLRTHLVGLQDCLKRLTETAKYITEKYQEEVSV